MVSERLLLWVLGVEGGLLVVALVVFLVTACGDRAPSLSSGP